MKLPIFPLLASITLALFGACLFPAFSAPSRDTAPSAAVFNDPALGLDQTLARETARQVQAAGYAVEFIDLGVLTNRTRLTTNQFDLLVLPYARELPADTVPVVTSFLKEGGDLLALGLPAWNTPRFAANGRWITREEYDRILAVQRPSHPLFEFNPATVARWTRSSNDAKSPARYESLPGESGPALHATLANLSSWDTFLSPAGLAHPFPANHSLTCLRARGGPRTKVLMLEWAEQDGSRWIATIDLTPEWTWYALPPSAFLPWEPPPGRGGAGDSLRVENAVRLCVGVAMSHGAEPGAHEYWIANLGTAPHPFGNFAPASPLNLPRLESLAPGYQCYPVTTPALVKVSHEKTPLETWEDGRARPPGAPLQINPGKLSFAPAENLLALHPRPRGIGYRQDRPWRWEPLLGAYDQTNGDYRGALAALVVNVKPPYRGGVWACFTPAEVEFYRQPLVTNCLAQTLRRMRQGLFFAEAGAEVFTAFPDEPNLQLGATAVNFSRQAITNLSVEVSLTEPRPSGSDPAPILSKPGVSSLYTNFSLLPGQARSVEQLLPAPLKPETRIEAVLRFQDQPLDKLGHQFYRARNPSGEPSSFAQIRNGGFWLDGKPWRAHGVNYMPSSGIGVASDYFEHWLGRGAYDPSVIQRDLERVRAMGLNAVSIFIYHRSLDANHLLDFLRRCRALGLRVNLSLRPGTPLNFRWQEMRELIEHYRLAQNETVFAYDLAWEPSHSDQAHQERAYTAAWTEWVVKRYGSFAAAEKAWNFSAGLREKIPCPVPRMTQLTQDGPWRRMVADYRLFLDEFLHARYAEARRLVRSIDPNHPVSFRMQHAGDPTLNWTGLLAYDFYGLAGAVDIWEPEAYGRIGDWDRVKAGHFTAAYARLCDPACPVLWAEMGYTVWDMKRMAPSPEKLDFGARFYRDFYRMLIESGADGIFFWWYPGGFRLNENSDFGILNPDGADREITRVIRTEGRRFLGAPKPPASDYWLRVDRDQDARGLAGIYEQVKEKYWNAVAAGKTPALQWSRPPGGKLPNPEP
jgi:hypothetical protein